MRLSQRCPRDRITISTHDCGQVDLAVLCIFHPDCGVKVLVYPMHVVDYSTRPGGVSYSLSEGVVDSSPYAGDFALPSP